MPTPNIDVAALTAPIPGDQPAGTRLPADVRKKMEDARKEFEPNPEDPSKPPIPKKPDWSSIVKTATESLTKTSKDLLATVRLVEALAKRDGFAGLRAGMALLPVFVTECWDRMYPVIEEPDDIEARAGPFTWLADPESGAWFPAALSRLPLVRIQGQLASLYDCQRQQVGDKTLTIDMIKAGEPATPTMLEDIAESLKDLDTLDNALVERMANQAPALGGIRNVLGECLTILRHLTSAQAPEPTADAPAGAAEGSADNRGRSRGAGASNRAETYRLLGSLADELAALEPHSPIPDLLRWAVKLGNMPFRELIQELVREPGVLADIRIRLGIKEESESPPA